MINADFGMGVLVTLAAEFLSLIVLAEKKISASALIHITELLQLVKM